MTILSSTLIRQDSGTQEALLAPRADANRVMSIVIGLHLAYCLALATWHDTYAAFALVGLPTGLIALYFAHTRSAQAATRTVVAISFMVLTALAIHQAHGMVEMHFGFFAWMGILLLYRDWRVYIPATVTVLVHNIAFNYLQQAGWGVYGYTETGWHVVALHIYYLLLTSVTMGFVAEFMRREALDSSLLRLTEEANRNLQTAERNLATLNADLEQRVASRTDELNSAKAAAEEASKAKTQFLASLSHQIREPLNTVLGMSELLRDMPLDDKQREYSNAIAAAGRTLHTIMGGTLDIDKIDALKVPSSPRPVSPAEPAESHQGVDATNGSTSETFALRILVAEDTRVHQEVIRAMLTRLGVEVTIVANGEVALASLQTGTFDLVFMDCQMPVMDGYEATRKIRELQIKNSAPRIPIIAITAHALAEDRQRCIEAGMDDFVTKPVAMAHLKTVLTRWMRSLNR